jgi:hypothetical protein
MRYFWFPEERKSRMKNFKFFIFIIILAFALPYTYGGCVVIYSSGDFDSNKDPQEDETSVGFIGISSQSTITQQNAESLAVGAFAGGLSSTVPKGLKINQRTDATQIDHFRPLRFPLVLRNSLGRIELDAELNISDHSKIITESNNLIGRCGGELSYALTFDKISGKFSGSLVFTDYCDDEIIVSGETDVDGTFEVSSGAFNTATFSFDDLSDDCHTLDGEISLDLTDTPVLATIIADSKDNQSGQVYWLKDYSINLFELLGGVEIEIFGTFYHPDNGFVALTTPEPFVVFEEDDWPTSGHLVIKGDNDTKAQLTAIDHLRYRIEADADGDGIFDWDSGIHNWTDL